MSLDIGQGGKNSMANGWLKQLAAFQRSAIECAALGVSSELAQGPLDYLRRPTKICVDQVFKQY